MKTLQELQPLIIEWANNKGLVKAENAPKQRLKLIEECGELASAILKNNIAEQKDAIGDIFVVLVILAEQTSTEICLDMESMTKETSLEFYTLINNILFNSRLYFSIGYLNDIAEKLNYDLTECANLAWNEIKNRTGKTIDGTFIKD